MFADVEGPLPNVPGSAHHAAMRRTNALLAVVLLLAACSSDRSSDASTVTTTAAVAATSVEATTTTDGSAASSTTMGPSTTTTGATPTTVTPTTPTTAVPPPTAACAPAGDTVAKGEPGVLTMSSMVGVDIRVGSHTCYERVVIEFGGPGEFPGWGVEYVTDPVRLGESDEFTVIEGDATLLLRMGMWMPALEEPGGYDGPNQFFPANVDHIVELRQTDNFEGITIWAIGLDDQCPFTVTELSSPARLVIDFQVAG